LLDWPAAGWLAELFPVPATELLLWLAVAALVQAEGAAGQVAQAHC